MKFSLKLCAITCSLMLSSVAHAIPINYTYESGQLGSGASITGDFTVNLAANITDMTFGTPDRTLIDFTFTNGTETLSKANGAVVNTSRFLTDTQGRITDFTIRVDGPRPLAGQSGFYYFSLNYDDGGGLTGPGNSAGATSLRWFSRFGRHRGITDRGTSLGTLQTEGNVPEPGTLGLLAAGLLGVGIRRKIGGRRA